MRGAAVGKGLHRLVYTYSPQSFHVGWRVSMAGLGALLVLGLALVRWPVDPLLGGAGGPFDGPVTDFFLPRSDGRA